MNVILHPVENPGRRADGVRPAEADADAHAARRPLQRARQDVASQVGLPIRCCRNRSCAARVWRDWLPDIYLNPHGYPSHEWVQQFAGYVPPGFRTYLSTRGWYTTIGDAARSALSGSRRGDRGAARGDRRARSTRNPDVRAMDLRHQARYRKWAYGFGPYVFNQEIYKDTAIYYSDPETGEPSGSRRFGAGRGGNPAGEAAAAAAPAASR